LPRPIPACQARGPVHGAFAAAARPRGQAHRVNPGRPGQLAWPGSRIGPGTRPPAGVFAPAALAGRAGKVPAAGQL